MKRILALLLVATVAVFYVACGGSPKASFGAMASSAPAAANEQMMMKDTAALPDGNGQGMDAGGESGTLTEQETAREGRKIIYDSTLSMETLDFAATQKTLQEALKAAYGYTSNTSLENDSYEGAMRRATYVYRIPAEKYADFLTALGEAGNVTSQEESTQDITAEYVDVEARLKSLRAQETSLLEMLAQAGELETLLAIQNQLTEVQYRIESYSAQQRTFDNLVEYCTVTVYVNEVKHATEVKDTFGDRVGAAFRESWRNFADGCQSFVVGVVYFVPTLLVLLVLGLIVFLIVRAANRYAKAHPVARKVQQPMAGSIVQPQMTQAAMYQTAQQVAPQKETETKPE